MKIWMFLIVLCGNSVAAQPRNSVIIDEIMADPTPVVSLPGVEWIELKNTSTLTINLLNWRMGDPGGQSGPMTSYQLMPDSFVIICATGSAPILSLLGPVIAVSNFPSLDNDNDQLYVKNGAGSVIHAIHYSASWYGNELKRSGGWTLEMIDPSNPCAGAANWTASIAASGGTPGKTNAVDGITSNRPAPVMINSYTIDSSTIIIEFDEPVDSISATALTNYAVDGGIVLTSAVCIPPLFKQVRLNCGNIIAKQKIYTVTATGIKGCSGNTAANPSLIRTGRSDDPLAGDCVINEVLFDPHPGGVDYVEIYNNSDKIIDAFSLSVANRNNAGSISSISAVSDTPCYIFPGEYLAITTDQQLLAKYYTLRYPDRIKQVVSLPSFPDDKGFVVLLNFQGLVTDELQYDADWHFKLLSNKEGVSLERLDARSPTQQRDNWHSASFTSGYGTPGYKNSQYYPMEISNTVLTIDPPVFSPDNNGYQDMLRIRYSLPAPGFVATVTIFDATGRPVRYLVPNVQAGITGYWSWDGLDDKGHILPIGVYIIFTHLFNLQGKRLQFRNSVVLARPLK